MKNEPLISVIIAVYNPGKYLRACLDSIVNQTYRNLEIILVDDGSTDDSLRICQEYAERDNRVIVHHKENSGVSATRNQGIRLAHGDYFSFIDSDDILEIDAFEYLINLIKEHNVDAVNYEHYITFPQNETVHKLAPDNYGLFDKRGAMKQLVYNVAFAWNKLFSKKIIENVWFDEEICRGEDGLFARQAFDKAESVWFDSRPLYHYIQSEESAVRGKFRTSQLTAIKLIDKYDVFFGEKYPELHGHVMSMLLYLMAMLYWDMHNDSQNLESEKAMVKKEFNKLYPKVSKSTLPRKNRLLLKLFRISPKLFCIIKKLK